MDPPSQIHAKWIANENDNNLRTNNQIHPSGWKGKRAKRPRANLSAIHNEGIP